MKGVRLPDDDLIIIKDAFVKHFKYNDQLWIFGSRANLQKKGGDIDLYIETHEPSIDIACSCEKNFYIELIDRLEDQKIDIILNILALKGELPVYEIAKNQGIRLI